MKKALLIIAKNLFQDHEYRDTRAELEKAGVQITTASSSLGTATGKFGGSQKVDITIDQANVADYDAAVFIGGPGAGEYFNSARAHAIAKETLAAGKILAAICIAPVTLANAQVLRGKKATVFSSGGQDLIKGGANYTKAPVEIDSNIITADGPQSAPAFGATLANALK